MRDYIHTNVWVAFFILMALATNVGFIYSWSGIALFFATIFNIIATLIKYRTKVKTILGEISFAASLVAVLHLVTSCLIILIAGGVFIQLEPEKITSLLAVGFAMGALIVNILSVAILVLESTR